MSIDARARQAGADIRERAAARAIPPIAVPDGRARRRRFPIVAPAAAAVVVVAALALTAGGRSGRTDVAGPPDGVEPAPFVVERVGVSVEVPSTWSTGEGLGGHASIGDRSGFVLVHRWIGRERVDIDQAGRERARGLESEGATEIEVSTTEISGRPTAVLTYRYPDDEGGTVLDTEHLVDLGDGTYAGVVVGESAPADRVELLAWVSSTIEVDPAAADRLWPAEAAASEPPAGVEPTTFAPPRFGASIQVPSTWEQEDGFALQLGWRHGLFPPNGGGAVLLTSHSTPMARRADEVAGQPGAELRSTEPATVDGRPAVVNRYTIPAAVGPGRIAFAEYAVDLPDGSTLLVAIGNAGLHDEELLDWIRSTIRITSPPA